MKVIDISHHHGALDWKKVKAAGVGGVIIRAGRGQAGLDRMFHNHINGAISVGLPIGIYYFSYAYTKKMARREAARCLEIIKPYREKITMPVYFDWEYDSMKYARANGVKPDRALITTMHKAFLEPIEAAGYRGGYYSNYDYIKSGYIDKAALKGYSFWYARYTSKEQSGCDLWQYTESGRIAGVSGTFDINKVINKKILGGTAAATPAAKEEKKAVDIMGGVKMPTIKKGASGKAVSVWQIIAGAAVDGDFGEQTEEKTKAFQKAHGLAEDGVVGPITWKAGLESI